MDQRRSRPLNRSDPLPLYHQLRRRLMGEILSGHFVLDRPFPSERELIKRFAVSRMTVRLALQELVREGWLRRERGRGSFVMLPKVSRQADRLMGFGDGEQVVGAPVVIRELSLRLVGSSAALPSGLTRHPSLVVYRAERLGLLRDQPVMHSVAYMRVPARTRLTTTLLQEFGSHYALLELRVGIAISHGSRTLEAVEARRREARLLRVRPGAPLLLVRTTTFDSSGEVVMHSDNTYRGDRFQYSVPYIERHAAQATVPRTRPGRERSGDESRGG